MDYHSCYATRSLFWSSRFSAACRAKPAVSKHWGSQTCVTSFRIESVLLYSLLVRKHANTSCGGACVCACEVLRSVVGGILGVLHRAVVRIAGCDAPSYRLVRLCFFHYDDCCQSSREATRSSTTSSTFAASPRSCWSTCGPSRPTERASSVTRRTARSALFSSIHVNRVVFLFC